MIRIKVLTMKSLHHLCRATIGDGNALAVEVNLFRHTYNTLRPHQALDERTPRAVYPPLTSWIRLRAAA
jgi:hypothetical protein